MTSVWRSDGETPAEAEAIMKKGMSRISISRKTRHLEVKRAEQNETTEETFHVQVDQPKRIEQSKQWAWLVVPPNNVS